MQGPFRNLGGASAGVAEDRSSPVAAHDLRASSDARLLSEGMADAEWRFVSAYNFGLSQEDERTEAEALSLGPGDHVLCIASAGEMPLSLLALGALRVTAVDIDAAQLHLTALKLAAVQALAKDDLLGFLGYLPASPRARRDAMEAVAPFLDAEPRGFWRSHATLVQRGVIWQGRYERYVRLLIALASPLLGRRRLEGIFETSGLEDQAAYFDRELGRPVVRAIFRAAFNPRVFGGRGMDPRSLQYRKRDEPLGEQYFRQFRAFCTRHPARENHHLQLTLLGRLLDASATPACFSLAGMEALRARHKALRLVHADVRVALESEPARTYRKVQLSNLADWLSADEFDLLLRMLAAKIARPGRAVWRYLHVVRSIPPDVRAVLHTDEVLGARLAEADRFPFYGIVPISAEGP
jgi:S-adenosylmethionine-diacylglycerol 3-amino-3-carboxypropyl transferase